MHLRTSWSAGLLLALAACIWQPVDGATRLDLQEALAAGHRAPFPGVVILKLRQPIHATPTKTTGVQPVDAALLRHWTQEITPILPGLEASGKLGATDLSRIYNVRYSSGASPEVVAAELSGLPGVEYAEPRYVYALTATPNDPFYTNQQNDLKRMKFPEAWDVTKGEQGSVVVAIVDGGTSWRHVDLVGNIWANPGEIAGNQIDDDGNGFVDDVRGWNFANNSNDPTGIGFGGDHGTHTAGIACAVTHNSTGVAGASWNSKVIPINTAHPQFDGAIAFGFDGIAYAALEGADVISCSWGGVGSPSLFELEIIQMAYERGAVIVAAAGNCTSGEPCDRADVHFPSAYPHVLSVANVSEFDVRSSLSHYGNTVDVSAVGVTVTSTIPIDNYGGMSGTSMAAPHVAGLCALVKTRWPGYTADQVAQKVRVTSDNIDGVNPARAGQLGYGRINAEMALTKNTPAIQISDLQLADTDGDGTPEPGETVSLSITVTNYLARAENVDFELTTNSSFATVTNGNVSSSAIDSLETVLLPAFTISISPTAPIDTDVLCTLDITTGSPAYTDHDRFQFTIAPVFVTHNANNVICTVTSVGTIGFARSLGGTGSDGVGFSFKNNTNLLFEGALIMGTSATRISNAARGASTTPNRDMDFVTLPNGSPEIQEPGELADEQSVGQFGDTGAANPLPVRVRQDAFEFIDPENDDYLIFRYTIVNTGAATLDNLHIGFFTDWDVDAAHFVTNRTGYDATRKLGYVWDEGGGPTTYVGTQVLNREGVSSFRGIWNDDTHTSNPSWGIYDGYTDAEKWASISSGVVQTNAGPEDVSTAIGTGSFSVSPGDSVVAGFAFLGGDDLAHLQANATAAAAKWVAIQGPTAVAFHDLRSEQVGVDVVVHWRTTHEADVAAFRVFRSLENGPFEALEPDVKPNPKLEYRYRDTSPPTGVQTYRIAEVAPDGSMVLHGGTTRVQVVGAVPMRTMLHPASPNPFNPTTTLRFDVARSGPVHLVLYDVRGRLVRTLFENSRTDVGFYRVGWDGRDDSGSSVASGIYHARLLAAGTVMIQRLTLVR